MTLFMTPLVGAVSAVIGLALISARSALKLFNEDLPEVIGLSSGVWVGAEAPALVYWRSASPRRSGGRRECWTRC
jgi:hypothetical protein